MGRIDVSEGKSFSDFDFYLMDSLGLCKSESGKSNCPFSFLLSFPYRIFSVNFEDENSFPNEWIDFYFYPFGGEKEHWVLALRGYMLGLSPPKEIKVRGEDKKNPVFRIMRPADMRNYGEFSVASAYSGKDDVKQGLIESNLGFYADMINSRKLIIERGAIWRILFAWFSLFFEEERAQKILPNPVRFKKGIF